MLFIERRDLNVELLDELGFFLAILSDLSL